MSRRRAFTFAYERDDQASLLLMQGILKLILFSQTVLFAFEIRS